MSGAVCPFWGGYARTPKFGNRGHRWRELGSKRDCLFRGLKYLPALIITYIYANTFEYGLVQVSPQRVCDRTIQIACRFHQLKNEINMPAYSLRVSACVPDEAFGVSDLSCDLFLPRTDICRFECPVKIRVYETLLSELKCSETFLLRILELARLSAFGFEEAVCFFPRPSDFFWTELHPLVPFFLHRLFDTLHRHIRQIAVRAPSVPAKAEEVRVHPTAAFGVPVAHTTFASSADEESFELMFVFPRAISREPPS